MKPSLALLAVLALAAWLYSHRAGADDRTYVISWTAPTMLECYTLPPAPEVCNAPLTDLALYRVHHGPCGGELATVATVAAPATTTTVTLPRSAECWAVTAERATGAVSELSATVQFFPVTDTDGDGVADWQDNCRLVANASQVDSDADGFGNRCDGDLDGTGMVNAFDTPLFRAQLGQPSVAPVYNPADLDANGYVNSFDTAIFRRLLGLPPGPGALP